MSEKKESLNVSGKLSYSQNWCFDKKIKSYVYIHAEVFGKDVADINQVEIWDKDSELHYSFFELAEGIKDNSYNGWYLGARVLVTPEFIKNELCKSGVLKISSRDHSVTTKPFEFCATELKKHEIVKQLKEGDENIPLNQKKYFGMQEKIFDCRHSVTLSLAKNFSRQKFEQFLIQIGGKVVLYQPEVDLYFVEPNNPSSRKTWNTLREQIKNHAMIFLNFNYANHTELIDKQYKLETGYKPK